jgi:hypothetical protein
VNREQVAGVDAEEGELLAATEGLCSRSLVQVVLEKGFPLGEEVLLRREDGGGVLQGDPVGSTHLLEGEGSGLPGYGGDELPEAGKTRNERIEVFLAQHLELSTRIHEINLIRIYEKGNVIYSLWNNGRRCKRRILYPWGWYNNRGSSHLKGGVENRWGESSDWWLVGIQFLLKKCFPDCSAKGLEGWNIRLEPVGRTALPP